MISAFFSNSMSEEKKKGKKLMKKGIHATNKFEVIFVCVFFFM